MFYSRQKLVPSNANVHPHGEGEYLARGHQSKEAERPLHLKSMIALLKMAACKLRLPAVLVTAVVCLIATGTARASHIDAPVVFSETSEDEIYWPLTATATQSTEGQKPIIRYEHAPAGYPL